MAEFEHGLAGRIRASVTSDQFDLAGYTQPRVSELFTHAFSTPLTAPTEMVKFTFVVGGGKLVRSRYDDDLPKWVAATLREIGYNEDRSAAVDFSSQGSFKHQHDTGQNLKTITVFPHVECANQKTVSAPSATTPESIDPKSIEYMITACEFSTFCDMVSSKTVSWTQRKRLLHLLQECHASFAAIEAKLTTGQPLTPYEQSVYDSNNGSDEQKMQWLQEDIKMMAESGKLTPDEKSELLTTISHNLETVTAEIASASAANKTALVTKLEAKKQFILARKAKIEAAAAVSHPLKFASEIQKCYLQLFPLLALEEKSRSMSLTMADLKALEAKHDLEESAAGYAKASRCWMETDEEWQARVDATKREAKTLYDKRVKTTKKPVSVGSKTGTAGKMAVKSDWSTVGTKKTTVAARSAVMRSSNQFAQAFSDDDD